MTGATVPVHKWRWPLIFTIVLLAHGMAIGLFDRADKPSTPPSEPLMLIDLPPVAARESPQTTDPPQREAPQPQPAQEQRTADAPATTEPTPPEVPAAPTPEPHPVEEPPVAEPPPEKPPEVLDLPTTTAGTIPKQAPAPAPRRPAPRSKPVARDTPPRPRPPDMTLQPQATAAAPPQSSPSGSVSVPSSAPLSWQAKLLAHLSRFKRYPPEARMRHIQGTALVHLRLIPDGSASAVHLEAGSGNEALDREAVTLINRAQPLPVPDGDLAAIEITVPVQFSLR